jgi:biopolymer transport protein ExbB
MSDAFTLLVVKGTFVLLIVLSALTWALAIVKTLQQIRVARQNQAFARAFAKVRGLPSVEDLNRQVGPLARVALAGVEAWQDSAETTDGQTADLEVRRDLLERGLRQQLQRERRGVEAGLPVLASVGSTAPFIGLFGTVLGIIHALQRISGSGSASLDVVAGPIGEALEATAIGIAVAVPAVVAYNLFLRRLKTFLAELEDFSNTFLGSAVKSFVRVDRSGVHSAKGALALGREAST